MLTQAKLHHVALIASDIDRSLDFYCRLLGFRVERNVFREERGGRKVDLVNGAGVHLELFSFPGSPKRLSHPEACGLRHLAFSVPSVDESSGRLREEGVAVEKVRVDPWTGKRFTFFPDPDGLPIELYEDE